MQCIHKRSNHCKHKDSYSKNIHYQTKKKETEEKTQCINKHSSIAKINGLIRRSDFAIITTCTYNYMYNFNEIL